MAAQNQGAASMDQFDAHFRRADRDQDGRISGAEAVSFFQGSGLPKQVLAQIWMHADQNRTGFLNRPEFYNALKLVTVAQSKRELTPEIVKAALYGPASSKIPAPQINLPPSPGPQSASMAASPTMQMGAAALPSSQGLGFRGQVPPQTNLNQQYFPPQGNQLMRPPQIPQSRAAAPPSQFASTLPSQGMSADWFAGKTGGVPSGPSSQIPSRGISLPASSFSLAASSQGNQLTRPPQIPPASTAVPPPQSAPSVSNSVISADWLGGKTGGAPPGVSSQVPNRGISPPTSSFPPKAQDLQLSSSQVAARDSKASAVSGSDFFSDFGGDPFSALGPVAKSDASPATYSASSAPTSSAIVPVSTVPKSSSVESSMDSLQSAFAKQYVSSRTQPAQDFSNLTESVSRSSPAVSSQIPSGASNSASNQSQVPWPKMTTAAIQKYTKVFMEVDTDRDRKISGEQARNLFLSWRLPREVLKQVWDLADQDSDSMLSLREFCIALYLMERYREGRPLPAALPNSVILDETLMRMTGLPNSSYGNAAWGATSGVGVRAIAPAAGLRRPMPGTAPHADAAAQFHQQMPRGSILDNSQANQLADGEQNSLQSDFPDTVDAEKKVEKVEKVILDSKEKLEYYRTKMQELVLYKSRCDNRLNEIIERALADKREAESLGKKYEEKYKQVAEIASKLTIEEAKFREYQERKMELQQAIVNMEQGGSADGILQVRADRIQSDLDELMKALSERCKKHGFELKTAALIELPKGWQPGIQEGAVVWEEEWDKFEDEGVLYDKEFTADTQNAKASSESTLFQNNSYPLDDGFNPDSPSNAFSKSEGQYDKGEHVSDRESGYTHSEDESTRSPSESSVRQATQSSSQDFSDVFTKSSNLDADFHRSFEQGWGTFDGNDDAESVWGFNSSSKDLGFEQHRDTLFESGSFDSSSIRTDSPREDATFHKSSPFNFADSVPGTPFSRTANSPRYSEVGDSFFDNYSRFDSFSMNESSRFSPPRETPTRFDSISSSRGGFDASRRFNSFDDADPFGSSGPFKVSGETPRKNSEHWSSF